MGLLQFDLDSGSQERRDEARKRFSSSGLYGKIGIGTTALRVYAFYHEITDWDFKIGRATQRHAKGQTICDVALEQAEHFSVGDDGDGGRIGCLRLLGKDCPACKQIERMKTGTPAEQAAAKKMTAKNRYMMNGVNTELGDPKIQLWTVPEGVYNDIMEMLRNRKAGGTTLLGDEGVDFLISGKKVKKGRMDYTEYSVQKAERDQCIKLDLQKTVIDLWARRGSMPGVGTPWLAKLMETCPYASEGDETPADTDDSTNGEAATASESPQAQRSAPKRGPGRPPGSKNRVAPPAEPQEVAQTNGAEPAKAATPVSIPQRRVIKKSEPAPVEDVEDFAPGTVVSLQYEGADATGTVKSKEEVPEYEDELTVDQRLVEVEGVIVLCKVEELSLAPFA